MQIERVLPLLLVLGACKVTNPPDLPDWSSYYPSDSGDTDPDTTVLGGTMVLSLDDLGYDLRFGTRADSEQPCALDVEDDAFDQIDCQADVNELDLYFHGFAYTLRVPSNTCEYLGVYSYMYEAWEVGTGPTLVQYKVDVDGKFVADISNSIGGKPYCQYDYKTVYPDNNEAPNCCYGSYRVQETEVQEDGSEIVQALGPNEYWGGGKIGECYAGAAFHSSLTALDGGSGLPKYVIVDIDETIDTAFSVSFAPPIDKPESSSVRVANYLDPSDPVPAGLLAEYASPTYYIECLDHAQEVTGRLQFSVREWDEVAEFDEDGNPDSGIQSSAGATPPLELNGSGSPINDYWDWADFTLNGIDYVQSYD